MIDDREEENFIDTTSQIVYTKFTYGFHHSYPAIIARGLGYNEIHNHAIPGGSTDAMVRIFGGMSDTIRPEQDIVIACWTGGDRTEYYDQEEDLWIQLSVGSKGFLRTRKSTIALQGSFFEDSHVNETYISKRKQWVLDSSAESCNRRLITNVIGLNEQAQMLGIKVMNLVSFYCPDCSLRDRNISRFWWPVGFDSKSTFLSYIQDLGHKKDATGHFLEAAHRDYAETVLNKITMENMQQS